jgi:hypothetical protein
MEVDKPFVNHGDRTSCLFLGTAPVTVLLEGPAGKAEDERSEVSRAEQLSAAVPLRRRHRGVLG